MQIASCPCLRMPKMIATKSRVTVLLHKYTFTQEGDLHDLPVDQSCPPTATIDTLNPGAASSFRQGRSIKGDVNRNTSPLTGELRGIQPVLQRGGVVSAFLQIHRDADSKFCFT